MTSDFETTKKTGSIHQLRLIWGAIAISVPIYLYLAFLISGPSEFAPIDLSRDYETMRIVFLLAVAAGSLFAAFTFPKHLAMKARNTISPDATIDELVKKAITPFLIQYALLESVTIMGLIMAMFQRVFTYSLPFAAVTILALLKTFPTEHRVRSIFR
jgi:hypothetical protein